MHFQSSNLNVSTSHLQFGAKTSEPEDLKSKTSFLFLELTSEMITTTFERLEMFSLTCAPLGLKCEKVAYSYLFDCV